MSKQVTTIPGSSLPSLLIPNVCHLMPRSFHSFSPCIVARTFLLCFMFRNSRNQIPCQVPVASFPFDIGIVTLAPIKDDLTCAYHIIESALPSDSRIETDLPACRHSPLHRACIFLCQLLMQFVRIDLEMLPSPPFEALLVLRFSIFLRTFVFFHYPVQRITHIRPHIIVPVLIH